jgi:homogentisate phytyltransferase/homogentisate geranylgeranyltransferase
VILSLLIGTAYSLPPIRLKRFPLWAALCIFGVRGVIVNLGFILFFQQALGQSLQIPAELWLLSVFIIGYTFAIAIFKDIPDTDGDRQFQILTFSLALGRETAFNWGRGMVTCCYGMMIAMAGLPALTLQPALLIGSHVGLLALFWRQSLRVNLQDQGAIAHFYQFVWRLFFLEYVLFPLTYLWQ